MSTALTAISDRVAKLESERALLDVRIEELKQLQTTLLANGSAVSVAANPIRPRAAIAESKPAANGTGNHAVRSADGQTQAQKVLAVIAEHGPMRVRQVADILKENPASISTAMAKEFYAGRLERVEAGLYGITASGRESIAGKA